VNINGANYSALAEDCVAIMAMINPRN